MLKIVKKFIKRAYYWFSDTFDAVRLGLKRKSEIKKFEDPRRKEIYSKVQLTDEQKKSIDDFFIENYGEKIPYTWHKHFTAFTGNFDFQYFPELLYIPEFEEFMTMNKDYARVFTDKNMLPLLANGVGIKAPKNYASVTQKMYRNHNNRVICRDDMIALIENIGEVFIKPTTDTNSGKGCLVANFKGGIDTISGKNITNIFDEMGYNFAVQERIVCHPSISNIYSGCVNTFRIITYRWREKIIALPAIMRIGQGGHFIDNAHAGGMFIAIDNDGTLHKKAFTEFKTEYEKHPDTNLLFEGYKIDLFPKVVDAAIKMHEAMPQIGCCNWDFTIDYGGNPVLIEANINNGKQGGSIWLIEMAHGVGAFGENTAEILQWIKMMKKLPKSKRYLYQFGYFDK